MASTRQIAAAREVDHEIGAHSHLADGAAVLGGEVAVPAEPGQLDHALELQLTPAAAHGGGLHGRAQRGRLGAQRLTRAGDGADLLPESGERCHAGALRDGELVAQRVQRLPQRSEQGVHGPGDGIGRGTALGPPGLRREHPGQDDPHGAADQERQQRDDQMREVHAVSMATPTDKFQAASTGASSFAGSGAFLCRNLSQKLGFGSSSGGGVSPVC